ncbi:hypothetical protein JCM18899A_36220 [Nocardioides sp. AN3]
MTDQMSEDQDVTSRDSGEDIAVGPIDYLAVEFPGGELTGEALAELVSLVDRGIIRILDLRVAKVDANGDFTVVEIADLDGDGTLDLAVFAGVHSGLLDDEDVAASASLVGAGNAVGVVLYENTWAAPFVGALRRRGAEVIASGRIPAADVIAMLEALEADEGSEAAE